MKSVEELGFSIAVEVFEAKEFDSPGGDIERFRFHDGTFYVLSGGSGFKV
jgi:hypothetical protein